MSKMEAEKLKQARNIEQELRRAYIEIETIIDSIFLISSVIAYLILSLMIAYLITTLMIAYLLLNF